MLAVRLHQHGDPGVLRVEDVPRPQIGSGEILVAMKAAALNHLDLWLRNGLPGLNMPLPMIMGSDGAGVVTEIGAGVDGLAVGDEIVVQPGLFCGRCAACRAGRENLCPEFGILGEKINGVLAQYVNLKPVNAYKKPTGLTFEEAASIGLVFLTAYQMLIKRAQLQEGETVLVIGGNSGVGAAAIQIAADRGARVIATASKGAKTAFARSIGAHGVVDHYQEGWHKQVLDLAGPDKVQVVFDHVGPATWDESLKTMGPGARLVFCGATSGRETNIDLRHAYRKHTSFLGSTMGDLASFRAVMEGFEEGRYRPCVDKIFPLEEIADAHRYLEASRHQGKIVVRLPGGQD